MANMPVNMFTQFQTMLLWEVAYGQLL